MAKMHPERLLSFEEGWEKLSGAQKEKWSTAGLIPSRQRVTPYYKAPVWDSWIVTVLGNIGVCPARGDRLNLAVANMMEHEGVLHGLPSDPIFQSNVCRYRAASEVTKQYIEVAMNKAKEELLEEIEKNGIGVLVDFKKAHPEEQITQAFPPEPLNFVSTG
jgi:hypothetical protein